jgi:hypothetical protein
MYHQLHHPYYHVNQVRNGGAVNPERGPASNLASTLFTIVPATTHRYCNSFVAIDGTAWQLRNHLFSPMIVLWGHHYSDSGLGDGWLWLRTRTFLRPKSHRNSQAPARLVCACRSGRHSWHSSGSCLRPRLPATHNVRRCS